MRLSNLLWCLFLLFSTGHWGVAELLLEYPCEVMSISEVSLAVLTISGDWTGANFGEGKRFEVSFRGVPIIR